MVSLALAFSISAAGANSMSQSSETYWKLPSESETYPFRSAELTVEDALKIFARNLRIGLDLDENVAGQLSIESNRTFSRLGYLDELSLLHDFAWYYDGGVLYVSPIGALETQIFPLQESRGDELIALLKSLEVYQPSFVHRTDARKRALLVKGPTTYLELVKKAVDAFESANKTNITVLRGTDGNVPRALEALNASDQAPTAAASE